jgi:uncharacterized iron-regulated membrane protein
MILKLRAILFWSHLVVGVVAGLFILNIAISGICIAYTKQITAWAESSQRVVIAPAGAARMDVEALVAKVQEEKPDARLSAIVEYSDPSATAMFNVGQGGVLYVNPYTGEVQGEGAKGVRGFFQFMNAWHRWLALQGTARPVGEFITGTVAILYFLLLISGLILWLPKQWSGKRVRQGVLLDPKLRGKARDWNWHNVVGLWCSPLLLFVTLTAIVMSHNWANDLLFRMTGNPAPEHRREGARGGNRNAEGPAPKIDLTGLNPLWAKAEKKVGGWHYISLRFSQSTDAPATFTIERGDGSRPDTSAQLSLDRDSGDEDRWLPYEKENAGQKLRAWVRPIHTGEAGGLIGQSIIVVAALGGITLVWTGLSMAWRRFFGKCESVTASSSPQSTPVPTLL